MARNDLPAEVLDDVVDLLATCPAFVGVDRADLAGLARDVEIASLAVPGPALTQALVVQRGALVVRDRGGRTVDLVAPGEFCAPAADQRLEPIEPSLVVWLPGRAVALAWSAPPDRLRLAVFPTARAPVELGTAAVRTVMRSPLRRTPAATSCTEAAAVMSRERISSIVVDDGDRVGIATDRDLRSRLVARGRSGDTPVGEVATFPVRTIPARTPIVDALVEMLHAGHHHLPVVEDGRLVGMVSGNDVLDLGVRNPLHVRAALDRAEDVDAVAVVVAELPATVEAMLVAGTTPGDVGRVVATITDRVQRRLLDLAVAVRGEPPGVFGWVAFGSQARREQTLHSDQDHGLLLPDGLDEDGHAWWEATAGWMVDALARCGYERCNGGVMAVSAAWRHEATEWRRIFATWMDQPSERHVLESTIAFDHRTVAGGLDAVADWGPTIARAAREGVFLGRLARDATRHRPPLGFLGRVTVARSGEHAGSLDLKAGAMLPIADVARVHALSAGSDDVATDDRLAAAARAGSMSTDLADTLRAAYELATGLRLQAHVADHRNGQSPDNWIDPGELDALARAQLREAFKAIRTAQQSLESRYHTGLLA